MKQECLEVNLISVLASIGNRQAQTMRCETCNMPCEYATQTESKAFTEMMSDEKAREKVDTLCSFIDEIQLMEELVYEL